MKNLFYILLLVMIAASAFTSEQKLLKAPKKAVEQSFPSREIVTTLQVAGIEAMGLEAVFTDPVVTECGKSPWYCSDWSYDPLTDEYCRNCVWGFPIGPPPCTQCIDND